MILRPGAITRQMLSEVIGEVAVDETLISEQSGKAPKAPGMKYRHYAPNADMVIVEGAPDETVKAIRQLAYEDERHGKRVGIIATNESLSLYTTGIVKSIGSRENEKTVARNLYKILREFNEEDVSCIYSEAFSEEGIGTAIMNRLGKAAGHHVIQADEITRLQRYRSILFVGDSGNCHAPVAAELLKRERLRQEYEINARGLVVLFSEPMNPRAEEFLQNEGICTDGFETTALTEEMLTEDTLLFTFNENTKQKVKNEYSEFENVYTLNEFIGEEKEVPSVYGQPQEVYEEMFALLQKYIEKLAEKLNQISQII